MNNDRKYKPSKAGNISGSGMKRCWGVRYETTGAFKYTYKTEEEDLFSVGFMITPKPDVFLIGWGLNLCCKNLDYSVNCVPGIRRYVTDDHGKIYGMYEYCDQNYTRIWINDKKIDVKTVPDGWKFSLDGEEVAIIYRIPAKDRVKGSEDGFETEVRFMVDTADSLEIKWMPLILSMPVMSFN